MFDSNYTKVTLQEVILIIHFINVVLVNYKAPWNFIIEKQVENLSARWIILFYNNNLIIKQVYLKISY